MKTKKQVHTYVETELTQKEFIEALRKGGVEIPEDAQVAIAVLYGPDKKPVKTFEVRDNFRFHVRTATREGDGVEPLPKDGVLYAPDGADSH